ncbi:MAG: hypothetical protein KGL39_24550 [Patescibacteria group bacterium]|nr:hypothetical protein [Patescibacteria group bacterium]
MKLSLGQFKSGSAGTAQEILMTRDVTDEPATQATISQWLLTCPGQSPMWERYLISLIHLRDIEGVKKANFQRPGMTHELLIAALNPEKKLDVLDPETWSFLTPLNLVEQFKMHDDASALALFEHCIDNVLEGRLWAEPPLSLQVEPWRSFIRKHSDD